MSRRTRNDVATASMSPYLRGHPKRERTTRRVSEQAEAHPSRRRIARPGLQALARGLFRASSRQELQALRDDHGPAKDRGTRSHAQCVEMQTAKTGAPKPSAARRQRHIRDTSPHQPANRSPPTSEVRRLGNLSGVATAGACPRHVRNERKPRPGVAVTRAMPSGQCGRKNQPKPIQPATSETGRVARQSLGSIRRDR